MFVKKSSQFLIFRYTSISPRLSKSQKSFFNYFVRKPSDAFPPFSRRGHVFAAPQIITERCKYRSCYFASVEVRVKIFVVFVKQTIWFVQTCTFTTGTVSITLKLFDCSSKRRPTSFGFTLFDQKLIVLPAFNIFSARFQPIIVFWT